MGKKVIPTEVVFIFVGERRHNVDKIAPVIGTLLARKYRLRMMFCHGQNIREVKQMCIDLRKDKSRRFQFIAIDVGFCNKRSLMVSIQGGLKPSSAVKKQKVHIGDIGYVINIDNIYSHVKNKSPMDCLLEDYVDDKVRKKVNKLIGRIYNKLEDAILRLEG